MTGCGKLPELLDCETKTIGQGIAVETASTSIKYLSQL